MTSQDGYQWTEKSGLVKGVPSIGVITPKQSIQDSNKPFDVIVVGAGYSGLTAARDATVSGLKTLLIEGRDRIGGRSWSSNIDGYPFEMGGTWVSWGQPHVWREISRYDMRHELELSYDFSQGVNCFAFGSATGKRDMSHEDEDKLMESALLKFVNIDGDHGKKIMPQPHDEFHNPQAATFDSLSFADRVKQIEHDLSPDERTTLLSFVLLCSCGTPENSSFYEFLHWWALCNHSYQYCIEYLIKYKFRGGQSSFAIKFFEEACSTGNLSYAFSSPVASVSNEANSVHITTRDGQTFSGARMISTIPLNVLNTVAFSPPLTNEKRAAADIGHVNKCAKVHAEVRNPELRSWTGVTYPNNKLLYSIADGTTPAGNTHLVAFGADYNHLTPEKDIEETKKAVQAMVDVDIHRLVFHNWADDEFSKGAWFFPKPSFITTSLQALRSRQGNIFFANSDWAVGWRSFIDGAIEEGSRAALAVQRDLRERAKKRSEAQPSEALKVVAHL